MFKPGMNQAIEPSIAFHSTLLRGWRRTCPRCGQAKLFDGYLRLVQQCAACALPLGDIRADDFPPYLTMVAVGHLVVPGILVLERFSAPSAEVHMALWIPASIALVGILLPKFKGMVVGWMHFLGLTGNERQ